MVGVINMLGIYLSSIIFWIVIIYSLIIIFQEKIIENGWLNRPINRKINGYLLLFCMSAVPILRLLVVVCIFLMACYTEEELNELVNRDDD